MLFNMAQSEEFLSNLEAISREELSATELREVLQRLSVKEFGGSERPTVAAVSEATGASCEAIGRILAEIRQQNLHDLFGKTISQHAVELKEHGREIGQLTKRPSTSHRSSAVELEMRKIAEERIRNREQAPYLLVVMLLIIGVVALCTSDMKNKPRNSQPIDPYSGFPR